MYPRPYAQSATAGSPNSARSRGTTLAPLDIPAPGSPRDSLMAESPATTVPPAAAGMPQRARHFRHPLHGRPLPWTPDANDALRAHRTTRSQSASFGHAPPSSARGERKLITAASWTASPMPLTPQHRPQQHGSFAAPTTPQPRGTTGSFWSPRSDVANMPSFATALATGQAFESRSGGSAFMGLPAAYHGERVQLLDSHMEDDEDEDESDPPSHEASVSFGPSNSPSAHPSGYHLRSGNGSFAGAPLFAPSSARAQQPQQQQQQHHHPPPEPETSALLDVILPDVGEHGVPGDGSFSLGAPASAYEPSTSPTALNGSFSGLRGVRSLRQQRDNPLSSRSPGSREDGHASARGSIRSLRASVRLDQQLNGSLSQSGVSPGTQPIAPKQRSASSAGKTPFGSPLIGRRTGRASAPSTPRAGPGRSSFASAAQAGATPGASNLGASSGPSWARNDWAIEVDHNADSGSDEDDPLFLVLGSRPVQDFPSLNRVGPFEIYSELGRGRTARVLSAVDEEDGTLAAVKVQPRRRVQYTRDGNYPREAWVLAQLAGHPHVVQLLGCVDGAEYVALVLEHVEGKALTEVDEATGRCAAVGPGVLRRYVADVLSVLVEMERRHIVHADLKFDNVLVTGAGVVKMIDFGAAHVHLQRSELPRADSLAESPTLGPRVSNWLQSVTNDDIDAVGLKDALQLEGGIGAAERLHHATARSVASSFALENSYADTDSDCDDTPRSPGLQMQTPPRAGGRPTDAQAGAPLFSAPEVLDGAAPTTASDLFALGIMVFTAATGRTPVDISLGVAQHKSKLRSCLTSIYSKCQAEASVCSTKSTSRPESAGTSAAEPTDCNQPLRLVDEYQSSADTRLQDDSDGTPVGHPFNTPPPATASTPQPRDRPITMDSASDTSPAGPSLPTLATLLPPDGMEDEVDPAPAAAVEEDRPCQVAADPDGSRASESASTAPFGVVDPKLTSRRIRNLLIERGLDTSKWDLDGTDAWLVQLLESLLQVEPFYRETPSGLLDVISAD